MPHKPGPYKALRSLLVVLGVLYIGVLASTYGYKVSGILDNAHIYASVALISAELAVGAWAAALIHDAVNLTLLVIQYSGFLLGVLNYLGVIHILFVTELITSVTFGVLLVRTAAIVEK